MKLLTSALVLTAAVASGCATYDRPIVASTSAAANPTVVVAEGDNNAMPYTQRSFFFKDRGLHTEDPSTLAPKIVEPIPRG